MKWKKMGAAALALSVLLMIICTEGLLQAQGRRGGRSAQGQSLKPRPMQEKAALAEYDDRPFDINADELPPGYRGHDPELIYGKIADRRESLKKSEFESVERYRTRVAHETAQPLTGNLSFTNAFAFRFRPAESVYSADQRILHMFCELSPVLENGAANAKERSIRIRTQPQVDNRYSYTNAYGKKVEIEENKFQEYAAAFSNYGEFPMERLVLPSLRQALEKESKKGQPVVVDSRMEHEFIIGSIGLTAAEAKRVKDRIMVLAVCNLTDPYVTSDTVSEKPTSDRMREYLAQYFYIHVKLLELWFYDLDTGDILMKLKPNQGLRLP